MDWVRLAVSMFVEVRGYGRSTRPPEMEAPPEANSPVVRTETAVRDLASAIEAIRARRGIERLSLLGWSWGTSITAGYTTEHPDRIARLALYGPRWIRPGQEQGRDRDAPAAERTSLPAYRRTTAVQAHARWLDGVPDEHTRCFPSIPGTVAARRSAKLKHYCD